MERARKSRFPTIWCRRRKDGHNTLVEIIAEGKDELMEEFFELGTLPEEHMIAGLHEAIAKDKLFPILCGSAYLNIGIDLLLNYPGDFCPSPLEHENVHMQRARSEVDHPITDNDVPESVRLQNSGRSVCRPRLLLQGLLRSCQERRPSFNHANWDR